MSSGGGGSKTQTVTQNNSPWSGVQSYLTQGYGDLSKEYKAGAPAYYPGNTVADFSPQQQQSIQSITNLASQGNPTLDSANQQLNKTISGQYLDPNTNPYLGNVANQAQNAANSTYAMGGRYGSAAHDQGVAQAVGNIYYQNYAQERQNQLNAINQAPAIDQARYYGAQQLGNVGAAVQQQGQNVINADLDKYNYNQNKDINWTNQYLAMLNGATGGSSTTTSPIASANPWAQYGGLALGAGGLLAGLL
jgi:hypothetical protein